MAKQQPDPASQKLRTEVDRAQGMVRSREDVATMSKEWRRLQAQKWRLQGGVEARMLTALGMYFGEHTIMQHRDSILTRGVSEKDKNTLNLVFNMLFRAARKKMGHLHAISLAFGATPTKLSPKDLDKADVVDDLVRAINYKVREHRQHWRRLWWLVNTGVVIEHTPWVEDAVDEPLPVWDPSTGELLWKDNRSGQIVPQSVVMQQLQAGALPEWFTVCEQIQTVGDVGSEIVSPLNFFIDAAVTAIDELPSDQGCFIVQIKTGGWISDTFGAEVAGKLKSGASTDLGIIKTRLLDRGPALSSMNMRDLVPAVQGSRAPGDPPMFLVATRYQGRCEQWPKGRRSIFVVGQEMLDDGELPYGEIPLTDIHYDAPVASFWTPDFITQLIPAQKFFNKRWSQVGAAANATINEVLLLGGELGPEDIPTDIHGMVEDGLDENGNARVAVMPHQQLPPWMMESTGAIGEWILREGGSDLMAQPSMPGQLRGPLALPILQELIDRENTPFYEHLGEQMARIHQMRVNRVKEYYPPIRTLHYTGENQKDEVLVFHADEIMRSGTDFTVTVDRSTLIPELAALRRARVMEDLNSPLAILYTNRRTGKLDPSLIAMAVKYNDKEISDRDAQYRRLAQSLIARMWKGQQLPPEIPYPFWDHNAMLDELEASMATTEWLEASSPVKQMFIDLYERCRSYLAAIQQAQTDAIQGQMQQGAMAQATQQAAARGAAVAIDAATEQIQQQVAMSRSAREMAQGAGIPDQLQRVMGARQPPGGPSGGPQ